MNIPDQPIAMSHQIHTYTELQQQIHDDLRVQHPDWVNSDGSSPTCDSYESRLMGTARDFDVKGIQRVCRCYSSRPRTGSYKVKTYATCSSTSYLLLVVLSGDHLLSLLGYRSCAR